MSVAISVVIVSIVIMMGILFYTGGIEIDQKILDETIQNVPNNIQDVSETAKDFATETTGKLSETINEQLENIPFESIKIPKIDLPDLSYSPTPTSVEESKENIQYINQIRQEKGRSLISFDKRVYDLALARVRDVNEYDYFDHTNPITGSCPDSMKNSFGFSSNEYLAENLASGIFYSDSAIDLWMTSQGHRYNLLFSDHDAGATVCESGTCVFLGLNNDLFGSGCSVAAEGEAWHAGMGKCSDDDFLRLDTLNQKYENLLKEYDKFPQMSRSQAEYQQSMKMYNELQSMYNQIENFRC